MRGEAEWSPDGPRIDFGVVFADAVVRFDGIRNGPVIALLDA